MTDRPLECSECHKSAKVIYTEVIGTSLNRWKMCSDCPVLQRRLKGTVALEAHAAESMGATSATGVCCGKCGTTLESVRSGHPLGCTECYEVFGDVLVSELISNGLLPGKLVSVAKTAPLHIGRSPGEVSPVSRSIRLIALNEALNEVLKKEDYEQAARLRDQIRALKEEGSDEQEEAE